MHLNQRYCLFLFHADARPVNFDGAKLVEIPFKYLVANSSVISEVVFTQVLLYYNHYTISLLSL